MSPVVEQLLTSAMALSEHERLELARALLDADEPPAPPAGGEEYLRELRRRSAAAEAGEVALTPWAEVKRRVRDRVEGRLRG